MGIMIACVLLVSMFAGCGSSSKTSSSSPGESNTLGTNGEASKTTKLEMWTFVGLHNQLFADSAKKWNDEHPDQQINLKATTYPYTDMHNKLKVALQSGVGAPDICDVEIGQFPNFLKGTPQLVVLDDIIAQDKDKFVQSRLDIYSKNGKLYGIPTHVGATVAFYNKEIFNEAGVDYTKIKTWDDFRAAGKIIKERTGKWMNYIAQTASWDFMLMTGQQDSGIFDKDGNVILDNETNIKTLQLLHDMIYIDKISTVSPGGQVDTEEGFGAVNKGTVASVIMPFWYTSRFLANMPDLKGKIVVQAPPVFADGKYDSVGLGGTGTVITNQCKNIDLAKKFLFYAKGTQDANMNIWTTLGFDPPRWDVWDRITQNIGDNKFTQYFANGKDTFNALIPIKDKIISPVSVELNPTAYDLLSTQVLYKVLKQNSTTPEAALKAAADELRKNASK
jgi:arabinosaccharide transport system substrate-binding protein